jgi:uncharacterized protein (DUF305 family)
MKNITQREVLFTLVGGIVGIGFMWGLITFTMLGREHMRDMDMSIDKSDLEAKWKDWGMKEAQKSGTHTMADGTVMQNMTPDDGAMHGMAGMSMGTDMTMTQMSAMLEGKTGDALDKAFLEGMIPHHEGAVTMAKQLLAGSNRPEMKGFARDIISAQSAEIAKMKVWQNAWFK